AAYSRWLPVHQAPSGNALSGAPHLAHHRQAVVQTNPHKVCAQSRLQRTAIIESSKPRRALSNEGNGLREADALGALKRRLDEAVWHIVGSECIDGAGFQQIGRGDVAGMRAPAHDIR